MTTTVDLVDDDTAEDEETFSVSLSTATTQGVRVGEAEATVTVSDGDCKLHVRTYSLAHISLSIRQNKE